MSNNLVTIFFAHLA